MSRQVPRRALATLAFGLASVFNPGFVAGCIAGEEEPHFGEPEMLEVLHEVNAVRTWSFEDDGVAYEAELELAQTEGDDVFETRRATPLWQTAHACGRRTFMQSAAACVTVSQVALDAKLTLRRLDPDGPVELVSDHAFEGDLTAYGVELNNAILELRDGFTMISLVSSDGQTFVLTDFHAPDLLEGPEAIDFHHDAP